MRAVALRDGALRVREDAPEPTPAYGQVLVEVKACGICGSDLHFAKHGARMLDVARRVEGLPAIAMQEDVDLSRDVFMGHEFSAEVLQAGPDTQAPPVDTLVTSIPILLSASGIHPIVYSNETAGGYGERMLLSAAFLTPVPNGLDASRAALTEPMAVGLHAVNRSGADAKSGAVVIGCGPVGLAVIAALHSKGIGPIVASDLSSARRSLAVTMGADEVVDPRDEPPFAAWARVGGGRSLAAFEAVGVPGIVDEALRLAPARTVLTVVGVCMEADAITPFFGIAKEMDLRFVFGYDPMEFAESLRSIAEGQVDVAPMITGEVGLDGVASAFEDLADPERHCKILVVP